ncbi:MAG: type I restriction-modification system subunit M N-terminal domain-containing protein [Turicibacter sp.]|nr:type I restriction-modification system subunit M N-terminal domain-containing protein [Turicibacter sp.]
MITGQLKNKIDGIWETFWTGGITNPLEVIEQITYLLFIKSLDDIEIAEEENSVVLGYDHEPLFPESDMRWSKFKHYEAGNMFEIIQNKVFPFIKTMGAKDSAYAKYMG